MNSTFVGYSEISILNPRTRYFKKCKILIFQKVCFWKVWSRKLSLSKIGVMDLFFYNLFKKEEKRKEEKKRENYSDFFPYKILTEISFKKIQWKHQKFENWSALTYWLIFNFWYVKKYFLRRWRTSQTVEHIIKGPMGKQKQIGLENYFKLDSIKILTQ